ncbi:hypothetical protein ACHAXA_003450 [Cyclostephanos tholiformis]|uniref:Uncharacterized protein n=1 Tax=Cyclostephanos tholiformis TaxID=382380 RepID=A0ABD3R1R7_9STRA
MPRLEFEVEEETEETEETEEMEELVDHPSEGRRVRGRRGSRRGEDAVPSLPSSTSSGGGPYRCHAAHHACGGTARSTLLGAFVGMLILLATYEYAYDEGVQIRGGGGGDTNGTITMDDGVSGGGGSWTIGSILLPGGIDDDDEEDRGGGEDDDGRAFTMTMLRDTRASALSLVDTLDGYYGGRERAGNMLVNSWQANWMLDVDDVSMFDGSYSFDEVEEEEEEEDKEEHRDDDDDADEGGEASGDVVGIGGGGDGEDDDGGRKRQRHFRHVRRRTKRMPKGGKALVDIESMSPAELRLHDERRRLRTSKLVSTMARAILDPGRDRFVIGTIGSSVAAGHDNCRYDSYESQLERTLSSVFDKANMTMIVQNAGEGGGCGDNHQNQVYCVTHNVGFDVDVVHYSWTYFEKGGAEEQREQLIRWAQHMGRRPMVHHLVARGLRNTCNGDVKANVDLDDAYAMYGYNAFCIQTGLYFGGHDYDGEMERDGINRFGWQYIGDGYHNTTRYGEDLPMDDPRRGSLGTVYRNWHPGPLGFQIASDAFAYVYVRGLLIALDIIERDMKSGKNVLDRWFGVDRQLYATSMDHRRSRTDSSFGRRHLMRFPPPDDMPEPLFCDPLYCSVPHPPSCLNYERPTFGIPGIAVRAQSNWTIWHEDNSWNYMVGKVDTKIIKSLRDPAWETKCSHLDACGGIMSSDSTGGTLEYDLPASRMTAGLIFVCVYPGKGVEGMVLQNPYVTFKLNGRTLNKSTMDLYPNKKCVRLLKKFGEGGHEKEDTMLLSIDVADQDPDDEPIVVMFSHVVAL